MKTQLREFNSVFKSLFGELEGCQDHQSKVSHVTSETSRGFASLWRCWGSGSL
ncbi:UNVERIFIED_CONTAM: hypothetical protein FKN15_056268 [Acipenser sinensis]